MKPSKAIHILIVLIVVAATTSCNLPTDQATEPAATQELAVTVTATSVPTEQPPTATSTLTMTATSSMPTVTVTTATNCRTGPGANYAFVMLFTPDMSAPVLGKYTPSYYWIISLPNGGTCWLWGAYANVQGDLNVLPEMTPIPQQVVIVNPTAPPNNNGNTNNQDSGNNNSEGQDSGNTDSGSDTDPRITSGIGPLTIVTPLVPILLVPLTPTSLKVSSYCEYADIPPLIHQLVSRTDTLVWAKVDKTDGYIIYMNGAQIFKVSNTTLGYQISADMSAQASTYGIASYIGNVKSDIRSATPKGCQ